MNSHVGLSPFSGSSNESAFLRVSELERVLPYKKSWIWSQVRRGAFPQPIRMSNRCTVWRRDEIIEWLNERVARRASAGNDQ
jgi:prophage regulatory protein